VVPPTPEPGTAEEFVDGLPIGLGVRVPMTVVSPWSRGGWVNSQVFDHTSVIRFLETWSGVKDHNISAWRREICGDLSSCFDFAHPDYSVPTLPDTAPLVAAADADMSKPAIKLPAVGQQKAPQQESGSRKRRDIPYLQNANIAVDQQQDTLSLALRNAGQQAVSMALYLNDKQPFAGRSFDVSQAAPRDYQWKVTGVSGSYDVSLYGPDRFLRRFAGNVNATQRAAIPTVTAKVSDGAVELLLANRGASAVTFTLQSNDFVLQRKSVKLAAKGSESVSWPLQNGYYDVVVTADDGSGFRYRFAGHAG